MRNVSLKTLCNTELRVAAVARPGDTGTNLNVISMFTVAERKSENSKLITWGGWLAGGGTERIFISLTLIDLLRSDSLCTFWI